jgi:hypothetical protein
MVTGVLALAVPEAHADVLWAVVLFVAELRPCELAVFT